MEAPFSLRPLVRGILLGGAGLLVLSFSACGPRHDLADLQAQLKQAEDAQDAASQAEIARLILEQDPANAEARAALAQALVQEGAAQTLQKLLADWERRDGRPLPEAGLWRGEVALAQGDAETAIRELQTTARHPDAAPEARYRALRLLVATSLQQNRLDDAIQAADAWTVADPGAESFMVRAEVLAARRQWEGAVSSARAAAERNSTADAVRQGLSSFERLALAIPALRAAESALQQQPDRPDLRMAYAVELIRAGQIQPAREELARALRATPTHTRPLILLGLLNSATHWPPISPDEALVRWPNEGSPTDLVRDLSGMAATSAALQPYDEALTRDPQDPEALLARALLLLDLGQRQLAKRDLRIVLDKQPENVEALLLLAQAFSDESDWIQTVRTAEKAAQLAPKNPEPWYLLARAYDGLGDPERSTAAANKAKSLTSGKGEDRR